MTESTAVTVVEAVRVDLGVIRADSPAQLVKYATEAADALKDIISRKKLFSNIQGKEYVKVEGWTTLATMMGCLPREVSVQRTEQGTYIATVELVRMSDQAVLTRASAECGMDENTWKGRADYARRSMAVTRATSKACRIAFSWVMVLAGYEVTPAEEIPEDEKKERGGTSPAPRRGRSHAVPTSGGGAARTAQPPAAPTTPPAIAAESLNDAPRAFKDDDFIGFTAGDRIWVGHDKKEQKLKDMDSAQLVTVRRWIERTGKREEYLPWIEEVLAGREGL